MSYSSLPAERAPASLVAALLLLLPAGGADAQSAEEILAQVDEAGYARTTRMEILQKVVTPSGDTRIFEMKSYSMDGSDKGLTEYLAPNAVRGMKILTLNGGDDIWTYFPRTNRTRKIASSARNRRVQGSDFTYDDMASGKMAENWRGKILETAELGGAECFVLELEPKPSGPRSYSKARAWIRKVDRAPLRIEYYDLDGDRCKRLDIGDYKKISGVLVPFAYTMKNLLDGGRTSMKVTSAEVNVDLDGGLFSESGLGQ